MKVILFGASGMVGQGVLRECLLDPRVESVLVVVRKSLGVRHPKLAEVIHRDFLDFSMLSREFAGADACFFCLGISSVGRGEEEYTRVTRGYTLAAARALPADPALTFVYVSGEGTDSTGRGRSMWARVKGRTENELLAMDFHAYMFRPGYIQAMHGATSKTPLYRWLYRVGSWLYPVLRRVIPGHVTTTENVGRAMLEVTGWQGSGEHVLDSARINLAAWASGTEGGSTS